ncbi:MAG: nucleotide exchange factor GrpE [Actinomycetaceae bacterium]|nr:nucleotide exchange factor GrpE [Actinomycetaceae bacterium]
MTDQNINNGFEDESIEKTEVDAAEAETNSTDNNNAGGEAAEVEVELSELDKALLKVAELEEQLARRNADMYNLQQEYNGYVRRSKQDLIMARENGINKVIETLLSVLDDAALAREHGDLTGPAGTIVDKLESTLTTNFKVQRFGEVGEEFDPNFHEALMSQPSAEVENEQIGQLIQPGYKAGDKVIRPARVGVVTPE